MGCYLIKYHLYQKTYYVHLIHFLLSPRIKTGENTIFVFI
jgi:hypothetical protein